MASNGKSVSCRYVCGVCVCVCVVRVCGVCVVRVCMRVHL